MLYDNHSAIFPTQPVVFEALAATRLATRAVPTILEQVNAVGICICRRPRIYAFATWYHRLQFLKYTKK